MKRHSGTSWGHGGHTDSSRCRPSAVVCGSSLPSPGKTSSGKVHANSLAARPVFVFDVKEERELNHKSQPTGCVQGLRDEEEHSMASVAGARSMGAGQRPAPHRLWILPDTVGEMEGLKRGVVEWGL